MYHHKLQSKIDALDFYADADHAGCLKTRKSTSGVALMHGAHLIKFSSTTQSIPNLSVAESELYASVKGLSLLIGLSHLALDWGLTYRLQIWSDCRKIRKKEPS